MVDNCLSCQLVKIINSATDHFDHTAWKFTVVQLDLWLSVTLISSHIRFKEIKRLMFNFLILLMFTKILHSFCNKNWTFVSSASIISEPLSSSTKTYLYLLGHTSKKGIHSSFKNALQMRPRSGYFFTVPRYLTSWLSSWTWLSQIKGRSKALIKEQGYREDSTKDRVKSDDWMVTQRDDTSDFKRSLGEEKNEYVFEEINV